jgi:hypothetical protein
MIVPHNTVWAAPAPLWAEARAAGGREARAAALGRPTLLRFASDTFMDDLAAVLENDPSVLPDLRLVDETWRRPAPSVAPPRPLGGVERRLRQSRAALPAPRAPSTPEEEARRALARSVPAQPAKLYHPAAGRFYLLSACLVCETLGMPDHVPAGGEQISFVMRRLRPHTGVSGPPSPDNWQSQWDEEGFVTEDGLQLWRPAQADRPVPNEERLPLFTMSYIAEDGRRRRLLAGLVPVGRRDAYLAAPRPGSAGGSGGATVAALDGRLAVLRADVAEPRAAAVALNARTVAANQTGSPTQAQKDALTRETNDQIQVLSWYALLDLSAFLGEYLPHVRQAIGGVLPPTMPSPLPARDSARAADEDALLAQLQGASANGQSLAIAVRDIESYRAHLERATQTYTTDPAAANQPRDDMWPPSWFVFRMNEPGLSWLFEPVDNAGATRLEQFVAAALPPRPLRAALPPPAALPLGDMSGPAYFVIRCLFECPGCGGLRAPTLSAPTLAFELASFFDPDAPARPLRISLPIDSTPGGLRKYTRNVALMLSDQLACQKERMGNISFGDLVLSVLPWPFHKNLPSDQTDCGKGTSNGFGVICSLSIPIITICALLLLIIIVTLFDIIFRWIPYFILCFPLPNFKGKR